MLAHERTAISTVVHPPQVWERFFDNIYSILKRTDLEKNFPSHQQYSSKY